MYLSIPTSLAILRESLSLLVETVIHLQTRPCRTDPLGALLLIENQMDTDRLSPKGALGMQKPIVV